MLEAVGISDIEEAAYAALLRRPGASSAEVARMIGISGRETGAVLQALEAKSLVSRSPERTPTYQPAEPRTAIEVLILQRQQELERTRVAAGELYEQFRRLPATEDVVELLEIIRGRDAVGRRFAQLQRAARREVLVFDKPPYYATEPENPAEIESLSLGVEHRALYDWGSLEHPGVLERFPILKAAGERSRVYPELPFKAAVVDREVALIPLTLAEPDLAQGALLVRSSPLVEAVVTLFEALWEKAVPINQAEPGAVPPATDLPPECRQPLSLLVAGFQDRAIARRLGIAQSTVDRRVRKITHILGARTRFQAGFLAARRGWIDE